MPRLTEVEKLATSDSSGGRVKTPQKRKYHTFTGSSPARTRGQSRKVKIASAALLEIGNLDKGSQSTSDASSHASAAFPQIGNLSTGNQSGKSPSCKYMADDGQHKTFEDSKLEGNRLIDLKDLQNIVQNHFSCTSCINNALDSYLEVFFQYTDKYMMDFISQANKMKNLSEKITYYEKKIKSTRELYGQFTRNGRKQKSSKGDAKLSVPVKISKVQTIGFASKITFSCESRKHFNDSKRRQHIATISPTTVKDTSPGSHASYLINNNAVSAFHHMGNGPYHMQMLAAWFNHPWRMIPKSFKKTEVKLGEKKEAICKKSMENARTVEKNETINNTEITYDHKGRTGIVGSVDMHWPQRGSGRSYNSDAGASYFIGAQSMLILAKTVFCKSCRICKEFLKKNQIQQPTVFLLTGATKILQNQKLPS